MIDLQELAGSFGGILLIFIMMGVGAYLIGEQTGINPKLLGIIGLTVACLIVYEAHS